MRKREVYKFLTHAFLIPTDFMLIGKFETLYI